MSSIRVIIEKPLLQKRREIARRHAHETSGSIKPFEMGVGEAIRAAYMIVVEVFDEGPQEIRSHPLPSVVLIDHHRPQHRGPVFNTVTHASNKPVLHHRQEKEVVRTRAGPAAVLFVKTVCELACFISRPENNTKTLHPAFVTRC